MIDTANATRPPTDTATDPWAGLALSLGRVAAIAALGAAAWAVIAGFGFSSPYPPTAVVSTLVLLPVNIATLLVVRALLHRRGERVRDLLGFRLRRIPADIGWALLWLAVLYVPFVATIMGVMFALHGADAFARFETVFVPTEFPEFPVAVAVVLGAIAVATFAPLNAPVEELLFRGVAQRDLARAGRPLLAIVLPSIAFGLQHLLFAPSPDAMLVYGAGFFVWGLGSAIIYARQRRLAPLVISHLIVNLGTSLPALIVPLVIPGAS